MTGVFGKAIEVTIGPPGVTEAPTRSGGLLILGDGLYRTRYRQVVDDRVTTTSFIFPAAEVSDRRLFDEFMRVDDTDEIFDFALRHGPLGRCCCNPRGVVEQFHDLHELPPLAELAVHEDEMALLTGERLDTWRLLKRAFGALDRTARRIDAGEAVLDEDLAVFALGWQGDAESGGSSAADAWNRRQFDAAVNGLIVGAQVRPRYFSTDDGFNFDFTGDTVLARLVIELVRRVTKTSRLRACAKCGEPFVVGTRRKYCADCGAKAARADASRNYRKRKKGGRTRSTSTLGVGSQVGSQHRQLTAAVTGHRRTQFRP